MTYEYNLESKYNHALSYGGYKVKVINITQKISSPGINERFYG